MDAKLVTNWPARSTLADQIACVKREIGYRVNTYPRWVRDGRMSQRTADTQVELMRDVLTTLLELQARVGPDQKVLSLGGD